jgi:N-acetylmuramoyl-L-alanine amidase
MPTVHMILQGGCAVAVIKYTDAELDLLTRLMRAEAEGDGQLGMLLISNVGVNRVRSGCLNFNDIRN